MSTAAALSKTTTAIGVAALKAYRVRIPLKTTIRHASHARTDSDNVIVECRLEDGTVGYGEGVPREYVTGETIETSLDLLARADWAGQLDPARSFSDAVAMAARLSLPVTNGDDRAIVGNAARCAAELALLDAFGKRFGESVLKMPALLPLAAEIHEPRELCRYSGVITSKPWYREIITAAGIGLNWFKHCKVKVGTQGQNDRVRLRVFRRILRRRVNLRVDANEAWSPDEVVERICELEPYGITSVEQPVAHANIGCLAAARRQVKTPIMHDESLCGMVDAHRAVEQQTCDLFNIRLSKCGGLIRAIELAAFANANGLSYQLGCQVGETGILSAAGRHFACSVKGIRYLEGSYERYLVKERLTRENLTFGFKGIAPALKGPGLGVTVDPERLKKVSTGETMLYQR